MLALSLWNLSRWLHRHGLDRGAKAAKGLNFLLNHSLLASQAEVAGPVRLEHHGLGVVMHPNVSIGRDVQVWHGVTLASETLPGSPHRIRIEDGVMLGAGCIVVARGDRDLVIGRGARVGAGAVVTRDVAPGAVVVGAPAQPLAAPARTRPAVVRGA